MEYFGVLPFVFLIGYLCFTAGQHTKSHPSEDEMFERLVMIRATRGLHKITREKLDAEINKETGARLQQV